MRTIIVTYLDGTEETFVATSGYKVEDGILEIHTSVDSVNVPLVSIRKYLVRR